MKEQLGAFVEHLKEDKEIASFDEAATKQAIVLRLLSILEWDTYSIDEVTPEYSVRGRKVDYCLKTGNIKRAFLEVKKTGEQLESHQEQLLNYSFHEGVKLAILTNGIQWWFYLPLREGSWENRKFYTIDIRQQKTEEVATKFIDFLSRENIASGRASQNAGEVYEGHRKQIILEDTLPKVWNKIIVDPDEVLIDLISETTEKFCGQRPKSGMVERFISENKDRLLISGVPVTRVARRDSKDTSVGPSRGKKSRAEYCKEALENLGGEAHLKDIHKEVGRLQDVAGEEKVRCFEDANRACLESNSRGKGRDWFEPVKIGTGMWRLQ